MFSKRVYYSKVSSPNTDYEIDTIAFDILDWYGYRRRYDSYGRFTHTYYKGNGIVFPRQILTINNNHDGTTIIAAYYKHIINSKKRIERLTYIADKLSALVLAPQM